FRCNLTGNKMKLVIVAQDYGFGPTAQAFILARELHKAHTFINVAVVKTHHSVELFSQLNPDIQIIDTMPANTDLLISSFEPSAILEAWLKDIPSIYYCNLLWFWLQYGEVQLSQLEADIQLFQHLKKQNKHQ